MRLRPVRFVGHKIGPFEHIELNWHKDSRATLIVGENGLGKTTLVVAMAACLNVSTAMLNKIAHDDSTYVGFEFELNGYLEKVVLRPSVSTHLAPNAMFQSYSNIPKHTVSLSREYNSLSLDNGFEILVAGEIHGAYSENFKVLWGTWRESQNITCIAAAYGVNRNLEHKDIRGYQELPNAPLTNALDPFKSVQSEEIQQWLFNQHTNYAFAVKDGNRLEAEGYLRGIKRIEQIINDELGMSVVFEVRRNPLRLVTKQGDIELSVNHLSDGTRSFLSWTLDYLMWASRVNWTDPKDSAIAPGLVLVDEIDSHLHPEWQRRVMGSVATLLPETYLIATTHSPFVVASAKDAQIFRLYRDEQGKIVVDSNEEGLYGYPADLVLKKEFLIDSELYPPEIEAELKTLSELMGKVTFNVITESERREHDRLLKKLSKVSPWLDSLLTLSQVTRSIHD